MVLAVEYVIMDTRCTVQHARCGERRTCILQYITALQNRNLRRSRISIILTASVRTSLRTAHVRVRPIVLSEPSRTCLPGCQIVLLLARGCMERAIRCL